MLNLIRKNSFKKILTYSYPCQRRLASTLFTAFLFLLSFAAGAQTIVEYTIPTASSTPRFITTGPDGNLWFTERGGNQIGEITTRGFIVEYTIPTASSQPIGITTGSDGNLWFTETDLSANKVGKITTSGTFTEYTIPTSSSNPYGITTGPDGNLWFVEQVSAANKIGKVTMNGSFTEYSVPTTSSLLESITVGPDGNLWFTENSANKIGKVTTGGSFTEYTIPTASSQPFGITSGSDGNLWFTESNKNKIGKVTTSGAFTEYTVPTASSRPQIITAGPDGNLWFTENSANKIGKVTTGGAFIEYTIPTASSQPFGITSGPDGNLWFLESAGNNIGVLYLPYTERPLVGTGSNTGSINPATSQTVNGTSSVDFTLTPVFPYTNVSVTGTCGGTLSGNIFTTAPVPPIHNCTVIANFYRPTPTAPVITSGDSTTFVAGKSGNFTVTDTGYPVPTLTETGALPQGLHFNSTTGIISGATNTTGTYPITLTATNSAGTTTQNFTLTVLKTLQSIQITSPVTAPEPNQIVQLSIKGIYSDGTQQDITPLINSLFANNSDVARVFMPLPGNKPSGKIYTRDPGATTITVTLGSVTGTLNLNVVATKPYLKNITLSAPSTTLAVCQQASLTAIGTYSDNSTKNISSLLSLKTSNSSAGVTYPNSTQVRGRAAGSFTVAGGLYTRYASLNMNVTAPTFKVVKNKMMQREKMSSQVAAQSIATTPADMCLPANAMVPIITELSPNAGPLLDAEHSPIVTIHGTDFMPDAMVKIGTGTPIQCQPNNSATSCTYIDNETLQLQMPVMNVPGAVNITVTNPDNTASVPIDAGANVYTVASLTGIKTFVDEQSWENANLPTVATSGPTLGGTGIALTGIFPTKGTAIEVDFDNVAGEVATIDSTNRITVNTPAHAAGTVDVSLYEKNSDGTKTLLGTLPHAYQYRPQRCTLGNGTFGAIDQCVTELKACVYVPTAPATTKHIEVTSHLVTNTTLTGGMPQCVDAMPKFDLITVKTGDTYPKILCTTANAPLVANRTSTPSAVCAMTASNGAGKTPNLTMIDLSYRDVGNGEYSEDALVVPLTWEDRVSLIASSGESYKGAASMQLAKSGYSPQTSSAGFCLLSNLPDAAHLPAPIANQNYCLNAGLYTLPNEPLGSFPWTLQTVAEGGTVTVLNAQSQLI